MKKMPIVYGIYIKHGRVSFLESAEYYSDHVNHYSVEKTLDGIASRWNDPSHEQTEAEKMVEDYNNGLTVLNNPSLATSDEGQGLTM